MTLLDVVRRVVLAHRALVQTERNYGEAQQAGLVTETWVTEAIAAREALTVAIDELGAASRKPEPKDDMLRSAIECLDTVLRAVADASGYDGPREDDAELLIDHIARLKAVADAAKRDAEIGDGNISTSLVAAVRELVRRPVQRKPAYDPDPSEPEAEAKP